MFDLDKWQEILHTISKNKLRTFLTALSVAWGIFILIILLGSGQGLRNGAQYQFMGDAINSIWINGGTTSLPYKGLQPGRDIELTNEDYDWIREKINGIDRITGTSQGRQSRVLTYGKEHAGFMVRSCYADHRFLENVKMISGRFINDVDVAQCRKVCAIGIPVREALFKKEDPIGKFIAADGISYKVVGVFYDQGRGDLDRIYIPVSTAQRAYNGQNKLGVIWFSTGNASLAKSFQMVDDVKKLLANRHNFDINDPKAISIRNNNEDYVRIMSMLDGIKLFVIIIGIGTLFAGIVGVSNIMMIVVKERTKEIGIRKALGATPGSIISLIVQESIFITSIAGFVGLFSGVALIALAQKFMPPSDFFRNPDVDISIALYATLLLVVAGALAGFFPALSAARVEPVEALRDE
ncbi:MAG: ABC transporter permease [Bacteroidia bacterium]